MPKQTRPDDSDDLARAQATPNQAANKEPAEGSRETTGGAGISNRPDDEEKANQERVPPRGASKDGSHA